MLLSPVSAAFEALGRAVVFLDAELRVCEASPAARGLFAAPVVTGQPLTTFVDAGEHLDTIREGDASALTCNLLRSPEESIVMRAGKLTDGPFPAGVRYVVEIELNGTSAEEDDAGEAQRIRRALEAHRWRRTAAARALGISRATLWRRMRAHKMI